MGEFVKFFTPMKSFVENFILLIIEANNAWRVWSQRSHANRFIKLQTMKKGGKVEENQGSTWKCNLY